jgi:hypothetical protein
MKQFTLIAIALLALPLVTRAADPNAPTADNQIHAIIWANSVDTRYEIRGGIEWQNWEAYLAPSYNVTTADIGLRLYGITNAIDADMVATLLGSSTELPPGRLYAGLFGGWKFSGDQLEAGYIVGGLVEIRPGVDWSLEYEHSWTNFSEDIRDQDAVVTGVRARLR